MSDQPISIKTVQAIKNYQTHPSQSVGLVGQRWLNKGYIAKLLAEELLNITKNSLDRYPYKLNVGNNDLATIGIEDVRTINDFLVLKVPIKGVINRTVIIERAERMTLEAQNALLKNLEEPPSGTVIILTVESEKALLPTIFSRLHVINVYKPSKKQLVSYYGTLEHSTKDIDQALLMSGGLPGLMDQLLSNKDNPINEAASVARKLLSSTTFERLSSISDLSKDKTELTNTLFVIKQMAKIGAASSDPKNALRWQKILKSTLESETKLKSNVQVKLLLTDYMLAIA